ncbi:MAG: hypothetical protein M1819_002033 [Sarea resinae]|nr:MAG: hypothetical protein M1819_002033 [Sarea resinae]
MLASRLGLRLRALNSLHHIKASRTTTRSLIAAPKPGSGPLLTRRSDRALPDITPGGWRKTFPLFVLLCGGSLFAIFNYEKQSSSVVGSTLYALRTSEKAREFLGDEIYFASALPWIKGELNQLKGRIDIRYRVKGTKAAGEMRFRSVRTSRTGFFKTKEWTLTADDGTVLQLLDADAPDPFQDTEMNENGKE